MAQASSDAVPVMDQGSKAKKSANAGGTKAHSRRRKPPRPMPT